MTRPKTASGRMRGDRVAGSPTIASLMRRKCEIGQVRTVDFRAGSGCLGCVFPTGVGTVTAAAFALQHEQVPFLRLRRGVVGPRPPPAAVRAIMFDSTA